MLFKTLLILREIKLRSSILNVVFLLLFISFPVASKETSPEPSNNSAKLSHVLNCKTVVDLYGEADCSLNIDGKKHYYYVLRLGMHCDAGAGGIFGSECSLAAIAPKKDKKFPFNEYILCKTKTEKLVPDKGGHGSWIVKNFNNLLTIHHKINAASGQFAPGQEAKFTWTHTIIPISSKSELTQPLQCDFRIEEYL
jgi:hypothetical protein